MITALLLLTALPNYEQIVCREASFLNKRGTAYYCDFLGQRSFYA